MNSKLNIEARHDVTLADTDWADWRLYEHNVAATGRADWKALGFVVRNEAGDIIGVAYGNSWAGVAELKQMWVHHDFRGRGHARELLEAFISEARKRGVRRIFLASYDFQAPKMYEKFGFRRIAEFAGWPDGHTNVFLSKELDGVS